MECSFCKKILSSSYTLRTHQKNTKTCIRIQESQGNKVNPLFYCLYCNKNFSTKQKSDNHMKNTCPVKELKEQDLYVSKEHLDSLKKEFEEELKMKDQKIKELETKSTITNTNIKNKFITNITINEVMTPERVQEFFKKHYNLDTLLGGQKGLARFIADGFISDTGVYKCSDRSRQKFVMIEDESSKEDPDCQHLFGLTGPGLPHIKDVYEDALFSIPEDVTEVEIQDQYKSIATMDQDRSQFKNELSKIIPSASALQLERSKYECAVEQLKKMRDAIQPIENKKSDKNEKNEKNEKKESNELEFTMNKIGEFSYGYLHRFRVMYQDNKQIRGPKKLIELFNDQPDLEENYIKFIKGIDPIYP